jgi:hypothetical protein
LPNSKSSVKQAIEQSQITTELLQYPIWVFWRSPLFILLKLQDIAVAYRLSVTSVRLKKQKAMKFRAQQNLERFHAARINEETLAIYREMMREKNIIHLIESRELANLN